MFDLMQVGQGQSLRERLLAQMQMGGGPVQFMSPFGQSLPNRAGPADITSLVEQLRQMIDSGQLSLEDVFGGGPEFGQAVMQIRNPGEHGGSFQTRGDHNRGHRNRGHGNRAQQARHALIHELRQQHMFGGPDDGRPVTGRGSSGQIHRQHRAHAPRIRAPRPSGRYLAKNNPRTPARRILPVIRTSGPREISMGVRRAQSVRHTRPSPERYTHIGNSRMRFV